MPQAVQLGVLLSFTCTDAPHRGTWFRTLYLGRKTKEKDVGFEPMTMVTKHGLYHSAATTMRTAIILYQLNYECLKTVILVFSEFPKSFFFKHRCWTIRNISNDSKWIEKNFNWIWKVFFHSRNLLWSGWTLMMTEWTLFDNSLTVLTKHCNLQCCAALG